MVEFRWKHITDCSLSKQMCQVGNVSRTCRLLKFNRNDSRTLEELLTGHWDAIKRLLHKLPGGRR